MPRTSRLPLAKPEIEKAAAAAEVSTKTLRRYLSGVAVLESTKRRIERALRALGLDAAIRTAPVTSADAT